MSWFKKKDSERKKPKASGFQKMKESLTKTLEDVKDEFTEKSVDTRMIQTSHPEQVVYRMYSWFWVLLLFTTIVVISIVLAISNPRFWFVAILLIIALPFGVYYCLIHMIPTIRIFGFTVFDRSNLSLRQQMNVSTTIGRLITREFIRENPVAAYTLLVFFGLLLVAILSAFW